ncbi:MAG TPA: hypothetical protein VJT49_06575 [Amycolatopsis sp.]|uniref:hypothetical protein n=1 Tax=Amycolatopsis sp. TaxID=37632 RepID=UPI002B45C320|nr:hypothetical protein [Amycolatopsis sp.]HKS44773.1 hypothetical protein [Amycolatopsis sp.]
MKKSALLAGGLALVVVVSGCATKTESGQASGQTGNTGSDSLFGNAQELVLAASAKTQQVKSSKFSLVETVAGQQITGEGQGRYDGANSVMQMTMTVLGQTEEIRLVGKTMYIQLPQAARGAMTGGKPWGRISTDGDVGKALSDTLDKAQQNDPSKTLEQIQQAGTITKSEKTTLDGQPVSHYWIDLDFAKAAKSFSSAGVPEEQLQQMAGQVKSIPVELWLNADQLPVQVSEDLGPIMKAAGAPSNAQNAKMTLKYSDWGTPVDVLAPPADQVGELKLGN